MTKDQSFMYLVMKSNNDMVMSLMGKSNNPCEGGSNVYDLMARAIESDNTLAGKWVDGGFGAVRIVGGIWAAGWAVGNIADKVAGESMVISGEGNTMNRSQTTTTTVQSQAAGETTGDNNLDNSKPGDQIEPEEVIEEGGDYLGIPGCSGEESYLAGRCSVGPE